MDLSFGQEQKNKFGNKVLTIKEKRKKTDMGFVQGQEGRFVYFCNISY